MSGEDLRSGAEPESLRLGLIVPTSNTVNETEWWQLCGGGTSVHTARMHLKDYDENDGPVPVALQACIGQLLPASPDVLAFGCTASSMILPPDALPNAMATLCGVPCTSTAAAIIAALRHLDVQTVAVATPYHEALNTQWRDYLEATGFTVTVIRGLGLGAAGPVDFPKIAKLSVDTVLQHAEDTFAEAPAQALLLSCTDMRSLDVIDELEKRLGVPVITSNTATLWHALSLTGRGAATDKGGVLLKQTVQEQPIQSI
jgi:maleate cis-trans isomerase